MKLLKTVAVVLSTTALLAGAYIVKKGDTLWDLSEEFFNDPFTWPDLWEKNRHIQDPHWIYPGDSLYMGEPQAQQDSLPKEAPKPVRQDCQAQPDSTLPNGVVAAGCDSDSRGDDFENMLGDLRSRSKIQKKKKEEDVYYYQQRPQPKIFNAYYQIHSPISYTLDELKNDDQWFSVVSGEKKESLIHIPESEIVIGIGKKTDIRAKKGDLVELWDAKKVSLPERDGKNFNDHALLRLSAYAKITAVGDTLSRATILQTFREVYIRRSKAKLHTKIDPINVKGYQAVPEANYDDMAQVIYSMDPTLIIGAYAYVLIDAGKEDAYNPGDAVAIWEKDKSDASIPPRLLGRGIITGASSDKASVLIHELYSASRRIEIGHLVSITHRADLVR